MDIQAQMDNLEKLFLAGKITEKEYDEQMDALIALANRRK
jgi:hypothetical protein